MLLTPTFSPEGVPSLRCISLSWSSERQHACPHSSALPALCSASLSPCHVGLHAAVLSAPPPPPLRNLSCPLAGLQEIPAVNHRQANPRLSCSVSWKLFTATESRQAVFTSASAALCPSRGRASAWIQALNLWTGWTFGHQGHQGSWSARLEHKQDLPWFTCSCRIESLQVLASNLLLSNSLL